MQAILTGTRGAASSSVTVTKNFLKELRQTYFSGSAISYFIKNSLLFLGAIFGMLIIIFIGINIYLSSLKESMTKSSREYIDTMIPAISTNWDVKAMQEETSLEFRNITNDKQLAEFFAYCETHLGKMELYLGAQGESEIVMNDMSSDILASYVAEGEFEKGRAAIYITLIRKNDDWKILSYQVRSDAFNASSELEHTQTVYEQE